MSAADWLDPVLSFVGGGLGGALGYFGARGGTKVAAAAGRRDAWNARYASAMADLGAVDPRRRSLGRTVLVQLLASSLATEDDRALARGVLEADATLNALVGTDLRVVVARDEVDSTRVLEDDEADTGARGGNDE